MAKTSTWYSEQISAQWIDFAGTATYPTMAGGTLLFGELEKARPFKVTHKCSYCGVRGEGSKVHSGTCGSCGAPYED